MDKTTGKKYYERHKKTILAGYYVLCCCSDLRNKRHEAMRTALNAAQKDFEYFKKKAEFETALDYASK